VDEILARLQPIFRDVLDDPSLVVTAESSARTIEQWDSLAHISIVSAIEQEFKVRFALGELETLNNVGEMIGLMEKKLRG
jgi:acyl carrier protein